MARLTSLLVALSGFIVSSSPFVSAQQAGINSTSGSETVHVGWLDGKAPSIFAGATFGLPWPRGKYRPGTASFTTPDGSSELQSWGTAYWPDGSYKWTAHAVPASSTPPADGYSVVASGGVLPGNFTRRDKHRRRQDGPAGLVTLNTDDEVTVDTGKMSVSFPKRGEVVVSELRSSGGKTVGKNGRLVLHSQSGVLDDIDQAAKGEAIQHFSFQSTVENVTVSEESSSTRALVTVRGKHTATAGSHQPWLPFVLRFYLYRGADTMRIVHSIVYDGDAGTDFITGVGVRFDVPLAGEELYDRHVRLSGVDGGLMAEGVKGLTGLRRDPGAAVKAAQVGGRKTPPTETWDTRVTTRLHWIPDWNDFSLSQLSPDGFTVKKRTKAGQSWVHASGGTRSGGLAYLGGATKGGLGLGLRHFWKRHPTGLDVRNTATDQGQLTLWIYSPEAQPLDMRPFHDGLGQKTYADQLDALEITYEDWEEGYDTPTGIARTNEVFVTTFDSTPSAQTLADLAEHIDNPPVLTASPEKYHASGALGTYWSLPGQGSIGNPAAAATIEKNLDFMFTFYKEQVEQRRWYGFLDHGDFMHTYDTDRHTWRYDVGGYGWDNSELSPDIFFWQQFLRTGRADVYRFAEALTRHTGEVDVYHSGKWKGLGTRHGVQHWSDSAKQARISTPQYRKVFYYVSGGDERVGELMEETLDAAKTFTFLDPRRKVRNDGFKPSETAADIGLGTDWGALAAGWLIEVERRGPRQDEAMTRLNRTMSGIGRLKFGFVTGQGVFNPQTGDLGPPPNDPLNNGSIGISHLSSVFGLVEVIHDITEHMGGPDKLPAGFDAAWLDYCRYYSATADQQRAKYGAAFSGTSLKQGHSRLTAYVANRTGEDGLARRAWAEFYGNDGLRASLPWASVAVNKTDFIGPAVEAPWLSTNDLGLYGPAAIENLQLVPQALTGPPN
ncbi:hypothetical protein PspLS_04307 [Pyricularia sp. CBS 133598]|nr:hypothetical protein PspLS_04307 [Pyricularia sp. CBS 133598]